MNDDYKFIKENLKNLQYHLEQAQRSAADLIGDILRNRNDELKKDVTRHERDLSNKAIKIFTKINELNDNELDDLQTEYMEATNGTKDDTDNN